VFDPLFDQLRVRLEECQLRQHLGDELLMAQRLSHLHDADDCGFNSYGAVLLDPLLIVCLFRSWWWDFDFSVWTLEGIVWGERRIIFNGLCIASTLR
jgi:hypothetical protein